MPPLPGQIIGPYRIEKELGAGGMGVVFLARDTRLDRPVAIKFISERALSKAKALERFQREVRTASAINHPGICTVYDVGEWEDAPFLVMEFLAGESLQQRLSSGRRIPFEMLLELAIQVADALEAAHTRNVLHRDIKPANLFLTEQGRVKLLDFGVAKFLGDKDEPGEPEESNTQLTVAGLAMGTAQYMSPEQARGEELDNRSDLFSLGTVLYQCATGHAPFRGPTNAAVFDQILNQAPARLALACPEAPPGFEAAVMKCLEKDRSFRHQTASNLRAELERLRRETSGSGAVAVAAPASRVPGRALVAGVAMLLAAIAATGYLLRNGSAGQSAVHLRPLTENPAEMPVMSVAVSPDGRRLAYGDLTGVTLLRIDSAQVRQLPGLAGFLPISWDPDGTRLQLLHMDSARPYATVPIDRPEQVQDLPHQRFSPVRSPSGKLQLELREANDPALVELWVVKPDGSEARKLLDAPARFSEADFFWLPGDRLVTFSSNISLREKKAAWRIYLLDVLSGALTEADAAPGSNIRELSNAIWAARGDVLFGLTLRGSTNMDLWARKVDVATGAFSGQPHRLTSWEGARSFRLKSSPDGKRIVLRSYRSQGDIYVAELVGPAKLKALPRRLTFDLRDDAPGSWTPDSSAVLYASNRSGSSDIYRQDIRERDPELLIGGSSFAAMPRLCGGMKYLTYSTFEDNATRYSRILLSLYAGGDPKVVATTDKLYGTQATDGICTVEFHESATERSLHELDPRTGRLVKLFRVRNTGSATVPLQGGQRFMNFNLTRKELDLLDRSGARVRSFPLLLLPGELVSAIDPEFSGGGVYLSTRLSPAGTRVLHVSLEGVATEVFRSTAHGTGYALSSPDGRRIALYLRTIDSNLSLLEGL